MHFSFVCLLVCDVSMFSLVWGPQKCYVFLCVPRNSQDVQSIRKMTAMQKDLENQLNTKKEELRSSRRLIQEKERMVSEVQKVFETELQNQKEHSQRLIKKYEGLKQQNEELLLSAAAENRAKMSSLRKELRQVQTKADNFHFQNTHFKKQVGVLSRQIASLKVKFVCLCV